MAKQKNDKPENFKVAKPGAGDNTVKSGPVQHIGPRSATSFPKGPGLKSENVGPADAPYFQRSK